MTLLLRMPLHQQLLQLVLLMHQTKSQTSMKMSWAITCLTTNKKSRFKNEAAFLSAILFVVVTDELIDSINICDMDGEECLAIFSLVFVLLVQDELAVRERVQEEARHRRLDF